MEIKTDAYKKEGMFLHVANGDFLDLSRENIKTISDEWWNNPEKIPPKMREKEYFKTCVVCPYRGQNVFCSAMKPLLPFLEKMNNFASYDKVTAVYVRNKDDNVIYVSDTKVQNTLQYVVNMSLFEYCENAKQFKEYFRGIMPFMKTEEIISLVFLNLYWFFRGDKEKMKAEIERMNFDITNTTSNCVKRLNLLCSSDAFMSAYINTQTTAALLLPRLQNLWGALYQS
jgi:hypothetical protein